ncbi:MAG: ATP-binding cassette domain-containing protein, partial [Clostridia bacterium]|nr:ATP-binding cassette domain-containing protein [Clostridia bacterium]
RYISYVPQGNTLLSGTIEENLLIGNETAGREKMIQALEYAGAADFVSKLPDGIETVLSEKSGGISEGQAQRIAIARALIADKPVLILDEATSALDEKTEALVLKNISENFKNCTCFIITHRKAMLDYCDRVIKIDDSGHIQEI